MGTCSSPFSYTALPPDLFFENQSSCYIHPVNSGLHGYNKGSAEKKISFDKSNKAVSIGCLDFFDQGWALETFDQIRVATGELKNLDFTKILVKIQSQTAKTRRKIRQQQK
jgi:hypothetical protein